MNNKLHEKHLSYFLNRCRDTPKGFFPIQQQRAGVSLLMSSDLYKRLEILKSYF